MRSRAARVTPTKSGLFVAVWRRAADGTTEPFPGDDGIDILTITTREGARFGQFAFPRRALIEHGIVSNAGMGGKRGFRLYPPWSTTESGQARRTQAWQADYF